MIRLIRPPQREWTLPNSEGEDLEVKGMEPEEPTNLVVEGFNIKQLPSGVREHLAKEALHFPQQGTFDLYQLPADAVVEEVLAIPEGATFQLLGFYGYSLIQSYVIEEAVCTLLSPWEVPRRYIFGRYWPTNAEDGILVGLVG